MIEKKEILLNNSNWYSIAAHNDGIYIAAMDGTLAHVSMAAGVISSVSTSLDMPYLLPSTHTLTALGRWDTRIFQWDVHEGAPEIKARLVSGRVTAIWSKRPFYVAASDKLTNINSSKDEVDLASGQLFLLSEDNDPVLMPIKAKGQIKHLAAGKWGIAFVDSEENSGISIYTIPSGDLMHIPARQQVTGLTASEEIIFFTTDEEITEIDLKNEFAGKSKALPTDFPRVLKVVISGKEVFLLTSEGVYQLSDMTCVSGHPGQPSDIAEYKNGLLTLWQDGTIERYSSNSEIRTIQIGKKNSE